jgi:HK97 family phage major capsid protein
MKWSAITLDSLLTQMFAREFAFKIDDEIIRGLGAGQPLGILACPALVTIAKEAGQPADTIQFENIQKMWAAIPATNRSNAVWFINQEVETQLDAMSLGIGAAGVPVYLPPGGISETPYSRLKGRPVIPIETCSALGDVGDIILADMSQYLYGEDSSGVEGATSIHLRFDYGEVAMRWTLFNDGQPWWPAALTPYKGAQNLSPFVTLAERA